MAEEGDGIPELLAEHARLVEEKTRLSNSRQTPPTTINYELTNLVNRIVERAKAERSEDVRSMLNDRARGGDLAAESALEWLGEEDAWWTRSEG